MCGHGNLSTDNDIIHKPHTQEYTQVGTAKIQYLCKAGKVPGHKLSYGGQTLPIFCLICGKMHWPSWTQVTPSWHTFQIQSITVSTNYSHSRNLLWKRRVAQKVLTSFLHHHSASLAPQSVAPQCGFHRFVDVLASRTIWNKSYENPPWKTAQKCRTKHQTSRPSLLRETLSRCPSEACRTCACLVPKRLWRFNLNRSNVHDDLYYWVGVLWFLDVQ